MTHPLGRPQGQKWWGAPVGFFWVAKHGGACVGVLQGQYESMERDLPKSMERDLPKRLERDLPKSME